MQLRGNIGEALASDLVAAQRGKQREATAQQIEVHNAVVASLGAPCHRGVTFAPVPRLCYRTAGAQGELALLERECVTSETDLNLLAEVIELPGFEMAEQSGRVWEVYLDGQRLRVGRGATEQLLLDSGGGALTEDDLARWLCAALQHPSRNAALDVTPSHLRAFVLATVKHLVHQQSIPLEQLARHQHPLAQKLAARIGELRDRAAKSAFQQLVLDGGWDLRASAQHNFRFEPDNYPVPANKRYRGKFQFSKHFYPVLSDLEDGKEEWRCALALDEHPLIKHWVRNIDSDPVAGFWLPTSTTRFYPDFVCELMDGRLFVVEYKGEHLRNVVKEIEKDQVGRVWAERSLGNACLRWCSSSNAG